MTRTTPNLDPTEIDQFDQLAASWWDVDGPMAPLHRMNPTRLTYIIEQITAQYGAVKNLSILDVGCGGGLVTEPLARLGASVTGIDGAGDLLAIAATRNSEQQLGITYRHTLTDDLIAEKKQFDVVLALEVIEHVPDQQEFIASLAKLVKPKGLVILSTLNRTAKSFALGIVAAEYILQWLPRGTHEWKCFVKPSEMTAWLQAAKLKPTHMTGVTYNPFQQSFALNTQDVAVNYLMTAVKA
jgi:2-polyprenyl-6-hydroxyphenyl methylase/3-demethylubiquinone-9 3-methyltransferase